MGLTFVLANWLLKPKHNDVFFELKGIGDLPRMMVETQKDVLFPLVCLLVN
jgi:hypothetical protein